VHLISRFDCAGFPPVRPPKALTTPPDAAIATLTCRQTRIAFRSRFGDDYSDKKEGGMSILWFCIIGIIAGWLAGQLMKGGGYGLVGDLVIGVIGAFVGGRLFGVLGIRAGGLIGSLIMATIGAVILVFLVRLIKKA
jgi:uncharacterized membrane protein YeaQ/YmgE (transglycosylase-associated protein family)